MAAEAGRKLRIKYDPGTGAVVIAGAVTESISIAIETIDITDKDDAGIRTLLDDIGSKSLSLSCSGNIKDKILLELANNAGEGSTLHDFEILVGALGTFAGSFAITSFESSGGEGAEAMTFSMSLESSGAIVWTAA